MIVRFNKEGLVTREYLEAQYSEYLIEDETESGLRFVKPPKELVKFVVNEFLTTNNISYIELEK